MPASSLTKPRLPSRRRARGARPSVGIGEVVAPELVARLPPGIALKRLPLEPREPIEVEFWIAPVYRREAEHILPYLRGLRVIQSVLAGVDWLLELTPPGVTLCDGRGVHTTATAEWAVAAILASLKLFPLYGDVQRAGVWRRRDEAEDVYRSLHCAPSPAYPAVRCEELRGKTVLIVGYGSIGAAIERMLKPFGVQFLRIARRPRRGVAAVSTLRELLPRAEVVVLTVPATPETIGLIGARELALMPRAALLVNVARGSVVETGALLEALRAHRMRAALDVTDPEPLPPGHPLWTAPNTLITPHIAASSPLFMSRAITFAAGQLRRYLRGIPLRNVVTDGY